MNYEKVDIENWSRRQQFEFFLKFTEPFFGITFDLTITNFFNKTKESGDSIFIGYIFNILKAMNEIDELKMRIVGSEVFRYNQIGCSATIARDDGTFGFSYIDYNPNYKEFKINAEEEINRVQKSKSFDPGPQVYDTIHFSSLPWIKFTSLSHARQFDHPDSIPKISCGKIVEKNGEYFMPFSIHVHHALVDGFHIGLLEKRLSELFNR